MPRLLIEHGLFIPHKYCYVAIKFYFWEILQIISFEMKMLIRYICLIFCLITLFADSLFAQNLLSQRRKDMEAGLNYNESIYAISNYSCITSISPESLSLDELLKKPFDGFYFYLMHTSDSCFMLRKPDGTFFPFSEALSSIKREMDSDSEKLMTLFLDSSSDVDIQMEFERAGLMDYTVEYDPKNGWPSLREMVSSGRRLVLFLVRPDNNSPAWLHNMSDYVAHTDVDWSNFSSDVESFDERLNKSLSLYTGYKFLSVSRGDNNYISAMARRSPYFIESFKRAWIRDGMVPNFVLLDKYYSWVDGSILNLRNFNIVYGSVKVNGEPVNYVNWDGMSNNTSGRYSFPLEPGAELKLSPSIPGYEVEPTIIYASASHRKNYIASFVAIPLPIVKDMQLFLPFEQGSEDRSAHEHSTFSRDIEIIQDPVRGGVASIEQGARLALPTAPELCMRDHDFTVGVWLKIPKYLPDKDGYCVLGGKNNTYQQALHLMIRDRKPYMGFYNNDLVGNTIIEPGKWYHVVWRYNKSNGEQAIFVDGKLDAITYDRPAYLGSDTLYVGHMDFSQTSDYVGLLDNISVWSRVLGDKEVLGLYNQLYGFNPKRSAIKWELVVAAFAIIFILFVAYLIMRLYKGGKRAEEKATLSNDKPKEVIYEPIAQEQPKSNYIRMFGEFNVLDRDGNDITTLFTPKIKQIFILIMIHSCKGESGISSGDLTSMIWGDNGAQKSAKSLRSVSVLRLRKLLDHLDGIELIFASNRYQLQISDPLYCDYIACFDMLKDNRVKNRRDFDIFYSIISNGELFMDESFDWLDDYKSYVCNSTVDVLSRFIADLSMWSSPEHVIEVADQILLNDPCNEEALKYKIGALIKQDNFKLARYTYDRFLALYQELYGEPFSISFDDILVQLSQQ